ncbi:MAG: PIN domain-containing protein [Acidobacteria bacterium]|nr:PIN domain-containing protein [Acidobacteriota bacterium]
MCPATHRAICRAPTPRAIVEGCIAAMLDAPAPAALRAGDRHWELLLELRRKADCRGNLVQDAYCAAFAIEHGWRRITTDRDFARFRGLVWQHPLDHP